MMLSTSQAESTIQFSPIPQNVDQEQDQEHDNHHHQIDINNRHIVIEPLSSYEESFDCESFMIILRLALFGTLLLGLALRQKLNGPPTSDLVPPKIFLNSLHIPQLAVRDGEFSSMWNITLAISNVANSSSINILKLEAAISYKEHDQILSLTTLVAPRKAFQAKVFVIGGGEAKEVNLKLNTTGWEKDQPIVDDTVIHDIAEDMQRGEIQFNLHLKVMGEVEHGDGWVEAFSMYPRCNNLRVKFNATNQQGEAAMMIDHMPRECEGLIEWQILRNSMFR